MNKKQYYVAPQLRVVELGVNHMLASSKEVGASDKVTNDNAVMNHVKQEPWSHTWE
ncbi:MAG: hypothetical protein U0L77_01130 [Prevotellamassilia sp.]|nr:hypothetical protein [Prevotellamassilia sp.]